MDGDQNRLSQEGLEGIDEQFDALPDAESEEPQGLGEISGSGGTGLEGVDIDSMFDNLPEAPDRPPSDPEEATIGQTIEDLGRNVLLGASGLNRAAGFLIGAVGAEDLAETMRRDAKFFEQSITSGLSEEAKADRRKQFIERDEFGGASFGEGATDPGTLLQTLAQSGPSIIAGLGGGGVATRGLQALGAGSRTSAAVGFGGSEGLIAGGQSGSNAARQVRNTDIDKLREQSPAFRKLEEKTGDPAEARDTLAQETGELSAILGGASAAALGAPAGVAFEPLVRGRGIARTRAGAADKGALVEGAQEGAQEPAQQIGENVAAKVEGVDPEREITEGALNATFGGVVAGGPVGGVTGFVSGPDQSSDSDFSDFLGGAQQGRSRNRQTNTQSQQGGDGTDAQISGDADQAENQTETTTPNEQGQKSRLQAQKDFLERRIRRSEELARTANNPNQQSQLVERANQAREELAAVDAELAGDSNAQQTDQNQQTEVTQQSETPQQSGLPTPEVPEAPTVQPPPTQQATELTQQHQPQPAPQVPQAPQPSETEAQAPQQPDIPSAPSTQDVEIPQARGRSAQIRTSSGSDPDAHFALVDTGSLTASNDAQGNANPEFPSSLQPRDRSRQASQLQIQQISQNLRPEELGDTGRADIGAPVIGSDGVVESGNARVAAIKRAFESGNGEDLRQFLRDNAEQFGINSEAVDAVDQPVLVRVRDEPLDDQGRAQFAREANQSDLAPLSAAEQAQSDAESITDDQMQQFAPDDSGNVLAASNRPFLQSFAGNLGDLQTGGLVTSDGRFTKQFADRVRNAVFAKAYGDERLIALAAEDADPGIKTILTALQTAAPEFARARAIDASLGDMDAVTPMVEGIDIILSARNSNTSVEEVLNQQDLFGGFSDEAARAARFMDNHRRSGRKMGEGFRVMGAFVENELRQAQNESLFGDEPQVRVRDVFDRANQVLEERYGIEQAIPTEDLFGQGEPGREADQSGNVRRPDETGRDFGQPEGRERAGSGVPAPERGPVPVETESTETSQAPASAGVSRSGQAETAPELIFKKNGEPYQTQKQAETARNRQDLRGRNLEPVQVEGGWALQPVEATQESQQPVDDSNQESQQQPAEETQSTLDRDLQSVFPGADLGDPLSSVVPAEIRQSLPRTLADRNLNSFALMEGGFDQLRQIIDQAQNGDWIANSEFQGTEIGGTTQRGVILTVEQVVSQRESFRSSMENQSGQLLSRSRTKTTVRDLLASWRNFRMASNSVESVRAQQPQEWEAYEARQDELSGMEKGDRIRTATPSPEEPAGATGELVRKGSRNWRIDTGATNSLIPTIALAPADSAPALNVAPPSNQEGTTDATPVRGDQGQTEQAEGPTDQGSQTTGRGDTQFEESGEPGDSQGRQAQESQETEQGAPRQGVGQRTDFVERIDIETDNARIDFGISGEREAFQITSGDASVIGRVANQDFPNDSAEPTRGELFWVEGDRQATGKGTSLARDAISLMTANGAQTVNISTTSDNGRRMVERLVESGIISEPIRTAESGKAEHRIIQAQQNAQTNNERSSRTQRKTEEVIYFVNWTNVPNSGRTTEVNVFDRLKDAREFAQDKSGYITRATDGGNRVSPSQGETRVVEFVGGFEPSAQEQEKIREITGESEINTDEQNQPAPETQSTGNQQQDQADQQGLSDFGETIEGARKFEANRLARTLGEDIDVASSTLSQAFPAPNYEKLAREGVDTEALGFVASMRAQIPAKPRKRFKLNNWIRQVEQAREISRQIMDGDITVQQMMAKADAADPDLTRRLGLRDQIMGPLLTGRMLGRLDPSQISQASGWQIKTRTGTTVFNGERVNPSESFFVLETPKGRMTNIGSADLNTIVDQAVERVQSELSQDTGRAQRRGTEINPFRNKNTGEIFVGFKSGRNPIRLVEGFASPRDAQTYIDENRDSLQRQIDELRQGPQERTESNAEREGPDRRSGDITPEQFQEQYSFRGVQFGKTVAGGKRQQDVNNAFDGLNDLAQALDLPPLAMSLEGQLGLAFGARGRGGRHAAKAHYEGDQVVINLTNRSGPGSLAHEWLHALDHEFGKRENADFMSEVESATEARTPVAQAWRAVTESVSSGTFAERSAEHDRARTTSYFNTTREKVARAFERFVFDRLQRQGIRNDFLVNINLEGGAYPTAEEMDGGIRQAFDDLFEVIDTTTTERGIQLAEVTNLYEDSGQVKDRGRRTRRDNQTLDLFGGYPYAHAETREGTTEAQKDEGRDAINDLARRVLGIRAQSSDVSVLGARLLNGFQAAEPQQLIGQTVQSPGDLAALAQVYRDPRYETFRVFFVKGNEIVGENAYTSRNPGSVAGLDTAIEQIKGDKERFSADGFYLLHNHPSGSSAPSDSDRAFTKLIDGRSQGLLAHVVINKNEFSVLRNNGTRGGELLERTIQRDFAAQDFADTQSAPNPLLGRTVASPQALADTAKEHEEQLRNVTVILTSRQGNVQVLAGIPEGMAAPQNKRERTRMVGYLRRALRETGSSGPRFLVVSPEASVETQVAVSNAINDGIYEGIFTDVVLQGKSMSVRGDLRPKSEFAGDKDSFYRIAEPGDQFGFAGDSQTDAGQNDADTQEQFSRPDSIRLQNPDTGNAMSTEAVRRAVADDRVRMVSGPPINIVQSVSELPDSIREPAESGNAPQGVAHQGSIWLIADNLRSAQDARRVLAHEAVGHISMEEMLGQEFEPTMEQVQQLKESGNQRVNDLAERVRRSHGDLDPLTESREIVARMAEEGIRLPVMKRIFAAMRQFLRRAGLGIRWAQSELETLITKAGRRLRQERARGADQSQESTFARDDNPTANATTPREAAQALQQAHEGVQINLRGDTGGTVALDKIVVPESNREQGVGSAVMRELIDWADRTGSILGLTPSSDFGGRVARLKSFYANFGFEPNRGRNRDFEISEDMVRRPNTRSQPSFARRDDSDETLAEARRRAGLGGSRGSIRAFAARLQELTWEASKDLLSEGKNRLQQGAFDRFHGLDLAEKRLVGNLPAEQSAYVSARLSTGGSSVMRSLLELGSIEWRDGVLSKVERSRGLLEVLDPVKGELDTFLGWMVGRRAQRLKDEDREQNLEQKHIDALIGAGEASPNFGVYEEVFNELDTFKKRVLDVAEDAGLIDPETRPMWDQADYIPFYRVVQQEDSSTGPGSRETLQGQSSGIRQLRGGENEINDPLENLILNFTHLIDASMKNHAVRQLVNNVGTEGIMEEATAEFKGEVIPLSQVRQILADRGVDTSLIPSEALEGMQKVWAAKPPSDNDVIRMMDEGKARYFRVNDQLLLRSLTAMRDPGLNHPIIGGMRWFKRLLTRGVTADPAFMARNGLRDALHAWVINEDRFRPGVDSLRGAVKSINQTGGAIDMAFAGGSFQGGYVNATDPNETAQAIRKALRSQGFGATARDNFMGTVVDTPLKFWEKYTKVGDAIENASRESVFEAAQQAGKTRAQSIFEAKDLMDYSMRGDWAIMQMLGDVLPFFNARVQGLYKLGRAGADHPGRMLGRGSTIAMASLALLALNKDDERYEQLPDWDKDTYWHIFFPESIVGEDAAHIRIPKPFEVGVLFGTMPERWARNMLDKDDNEKTFERFIWSARETFAFDPVPQAVNPMLEIWANRDRFRDAPIEGLADQGKLDEARFDPRTSATAKALGRVTGPTAGLSPKELEHLWRGYTGQMGMYLLDTADLANRSIRDLPPRPAMRIDDFPVIDSFLRAEPARSNQYLSRLFDLHTEANQIYRTLREFRKNGNVERAQEILNDPEKVEKLKVRDALQKGVQENRRLSNLMDQIQRDESMTSEEKRDAMDRLFRQRNLISRQVIKAVDGELNSEDQ